MRGENMQLRQMLNEMIDASDKAGDAAIERTRIWNEIRKSLGRPRVTEYQKLKARLNRGLSNEQLSDHGV